MNTNGKDFLTKKDFENYSIWRFDDRDNLYYPVHFPKELPENHFDIRIKAKFKTINNLVLDGYIVGIEDIYTIGIFINNDGFRFSKNLPNLSYEQFLKLISHLPRNLMKTFNDMFPLAFKTDFDWEDLGYHNFTGTFDAFEKVRKKAEKK